MRESVDHFGKSNTFGGSYIRAKRAESLQEPRAGHGLLWLVALLIAIFAAFGVFALRTPLHQVSATAHTN